MPAAGEPVISSPSRSRHTKQTRLPLGGGAGASFCLLCAPHPVPRSPRARAAASDAGQCPSSPRESGRCRAPSPRSSSQKPSRQGRPRPAARPTGRGRSHVSSRKPVLASAWHLPGATLWQQHARRSDSSAAPRLLLDWLWTRKKRVCSAAPPGLHRGCGLMRVPGREVWSELGVGGAQAPGCWRGARAAPDPALSARR